MHNPKVTRYLRSKNLDEYSNFDFVLKKYADGELYSLLDKYKFTESEIFPQISETSRYIEIYLRYQNIAVNVEVADEKMEYSVYPCGATAEEVVNNSVCIALDGDCSFEKAIEAIYQDVINHPDLKDISKDENKKKKYGLIANTCFCIMVAVVCVPALYVMISGKAVSFGKSGPWVLAVMAIMLLLWLIFDVKSKRRSR